MLDVNAARRQMIEQQVRAWQVLDLTVLEAMERVPREEFAPPAYRELAFGDLNVPLGHGQSMLTPKLEGRMLQALDMQPNDEVLEIGTGSGYVSACLASLGREVLSLEIHPDLAQLAAAKLAANGHHNVGVVTADALAWDSERRFDAICVTGAVAAVPPRFLQWLRPGGRLFVVTGVAPVMDAVVLHAEAGGLRSESLLETDIPYLVGAAPPAVFTF